ncbi:MAG: HAD-IIIA family hydrolase, partial [Flavisolibacter sp.]|nr:HAD-IIIA family hydrolase [Flavisolibacter sp.]
AIILAGGLGTRLRDTVPDVPKCMAPVAGRPFLSFIIDYLRMQGIQKFIFSLGYKAESIKQYLENEYPTLDYTTVIEEEPLGTGGAIQLAMNKASSEDVLAVNGDTLFKINVQDLQHLHFEKKAECTLALKRIKNIDRYGTVEINAERAITTFREKRFYEEGLINGGIYLINRTSFLARSLPQKFSFEKDYLEKFCYEGTFYGVVQDGYFIDIGIPSDYAKAQIDLQSSALHLKMIDKSWTLFLDRDGVINNERLENYVLNWQEFIFSPGVLEAFNILSSHFHRILIVSNQRGVGRELMTLEDLENIHAEMQNEVVAAGGRIDKIYYCTEVDSKCFYRKPNPGMALQAITDFPDIDFSKAIMVGNKPGDMRFGRAAGMFTVFLTTTNPDQPYPHPDIDLAFPSLLAFAQALES